MQKSLMMQEFSKLSFEGKAKSQDLKGPNFKMMQMTLHHPACEKRNTKLDSWELKAAFKNYLGIQSGRRRNLKLSTKLKC